MRQIRRLDHSTIYVAAIGSGALLSMAVPRLAPWVVLASAAAYLVAHWRFGKRLPATPANLSLGILAFVVLVNSLISVRPAVTFPAAMQILIGIGLLFSISNWSGRAEHLRQAPVAFAAIGIVLVVMAPFTVDWITDKYGFFPSDLYSLLLPLTQRVIHPNIMAGAVAVLLVTLVVFQRFAWRSLPIRERSLLLLASAALGILLIVTQSRGALVGVLFGLATMIALSWDARRFGIVAAVGLILLAAVVWVVGADTPLLVESSTAIRNAPGRLEIWSHALEVISDFRFTGIGIGNFAIVTDLFYPFVAAGPGQTHAHNLFLQIAVDTGLPGLAAWLSCMLLVLLCCIQTFRLVFTRNSPVLTGMSAGLLCGQLTMLVHGLMDAPLWATRPSIIVWLMWGIALSLPAIITSSPEQFTVGSESTT